MIAPIPEAEAGARLTIDLEAYAANWRMLADRAAPGECAGVVKADAYGIGIEQAVPALWRAGCRTFCVALLSEGRRVRAIAPQATIYVLNGLPPGTCGTYSALHLRPTLGSAEEIAEWRAHIEGGAADPGSALHVDTGLNRLGLRPEEAIALSKAGAFDGFTQSLLISHFVASEEPENPLNQRQIERFLAVKDEIRPNAVSLCNSSGFFLATPPHMSLARPGFALYGGNPEPGRANPMRSVVALEARIIQLRNLPAGETVGYNATWTARIPSRIAILSLGYADGITRQLANGDERRDGNDPGGHAIVNGIACPFAGRVSMDLIALDVTALPEGSVKRGDFVELLGPSISVDDVAKRGHTNGYEILTSLGRRYHRHYVGG